MSFIAIILDVSSIIWDIKDFEANKEEYYKLKDSIISFFEIFRNEKPYILLRNELINEMIDGFPFDKMPNKFYEFGYQVYSFLIDADSEKIISPKPVDEGVTSIPVLIKNHFNGQTETEVKYILTHIHTARKNLNVYISFQYLYGKDKKLITKKGEIELECETILADKDDQLKIFFSKFKKIFEPNPVHHKGKKPGSYKSPLSCFDGFDKSIPQSYLEKSILDGGRYYYFDTDNDVYVIFLNHHSNLYHGHDENDRSKIPSKVRKHFNK